MQARRLRRKCNGGQRTVLTGLDEAVRAARNIALTNTIGERPDWRMG